MLARVGGRDRRPATREKRMFTGLVIFRRDLNPYFGASLGWLGLDVRPSHCWAPSPVSPAECCRPLRRSKPSKAITIVLLFGMMGLGAFWRRTAFSTVPPRRSPAGADAGRLLAWLVWGAGILSALITNDAVCVLGPPLVCGIIRRRGLPPLPFLLALATAANTGSAATLVGNPQNMLCASLGGLAYRDYLLAAGPAAVVALAFNHAVL
jgi:hypothetical protein